MMPFECLEKRKQSLKNICTHNIETKFSQGPGGTYTHLWLSTQEFLLPEL